MKITKVIQENWLAFFLFFACSGTYLHAMAENLDVSRDATSNVQTTKEQSIANDSSALLEARVLLATGKYEGALAIYKHVESPSAQTMNEIGICYEHLGNLDNARAWYERAIRLDPRLSNAYNNLATVYYLKHNGKKAEKFYKKAIKINPDNASAFKNLGTSYFVRRKYRQGREAYEDALRVDTDVFTRDPNFTVGSLDRRQLAEMNFFLAELCAQSGQTNAAMRYLALAIKEGFHDQPRLQNDKALASVRQMPGFNTLLKKE